VIGRFAGRSHLTQKKPHPTGYGFFCKGNKSKL
jgi:hypothetical protein